MEKFPKEFTVDNMIAACKRIRYMSERLRLYGCFHTMWAYGFISKRVFDAFCKEWDAAGLSYPSHDAY